MRSGLEVSLGDLFQHVYVEGLIDDDLLQSNILVLELPQLLRIVRLHAAKLTLLTVPGRLGDLQVTADLGQVFALVEQFVALGELSDDLFGDVVHSLHGCPPRSIPEHRTLVSSGSVQGDPRTPISGATRLALHKLESDKEVRESQSLVRGSAHKANRETADLTLR